MRRHIIGLSLMNDGNDDESQEKTCHTAAVVVATPTPTLPLPLLARVEWLGESRLRFATQVEAAGAAAAAWLPKAAQRELDAVFDQPAETV